MFIPFIIWVMANLCTNPFHTAANHGNCPLIHQNVSLLSDDDDGGGETGTFPPKPPTPPPPPPGATNP